MDSKIDKSFRNSQFYRNYNNIDFVILKFKKIKNEFNSSKNNYENNLVSFIDTIKNKIKKEILKNFKSNLSIKNKSKKYVK